MGKMNTRKSVKKKKKEKIKKRGRWVEGKK